MWRREALTSSARPLCVCAQPAKENDCAGKGWMIAAMTLAIIQLIMVGWFGFIGIVLATVCEGVDDAIDGSNCLYECHDAYGLHSEDACTSPDGDWGTGTDCCASMDWGEAQTCEDGFQVVPATAEAREAVRDFCDLMGLMTLTAIARFALVLTVAISACCGVCCPPAAPPAANQGQPMVQLGAPMAAVPMAAVAVPAQAVAVPAQAVSYAAKP